jgi:hypothetical protein
LQEQKFKCNFEENSKIMIEVLFQGNITDLEGKDTETNKGKLVATWLSGATEGDALKYYDWALKLYSNKPISVDKSDFKKLREFIDTKTGASAFYKAQILNDLDAMKENIKD